MIPFSNGSEFMIWFCSNCEKCVKYEHESQTLQDANCFISFYIALGTITGEIPDEIYNVMIMNDKDFNNCQFKKVR